LKAIIHFANGESEAFNVTDLEIDNDYVSIGLKEKVIRPPDKHTLLLLDFKTQEIKKIEVEINPL